MRVYDLISAQPSPLSLLFFPVTSPVTPNTFPLFFWSGWL